ncbi:hypothetical protein [Burkholderia multivorans]|uniref:hypothetical protein n=1 Tax=Burkholderia multivorans TaxID=87883 RepID=UPI0021F225F7|nr:hypothetical protein [Burkholderia multivorans]MDR9264101.1 hypothetical protein [Burkholderia multivorans]
MPNNTKPILSREEVLKIVRKTLKENNDRDKLSSARFVDLATAIEAAVLERVCGEPVAWRAPNLSGSGDAWAYRDADDRFENQHGEPVGEALYAINRSKS